jgi:hypothetical protein
MPAREWHRGLEPLRSACDIVEVLTLPTAAIVAALRQWGSTPWGWTPWGSASWGAADSNPRPWNDIPGVVLVGIFIGIGLLIVAIRSMFNKKR